MPLPSALLARLAKRGITTKAEQKKAEESKQKDTEENDEEEVFAENYDEPVPSAIPPPTSKSSSIIAPSHGTKRHIDYSQDDENLVYEISACPNRDNTYHECSDYCVQTWGFKSFKPKSDLDSKRLRMFKKYPLPDNWEEVGDPQTGRYFYWNTDTDEVSWLPPTHPRTKVSLSANRIKELFDKPAAKAAESSSEEEEDEGDIMDIDDFEEIERKILMEKSAKEKDHGKKGKPKRKEPLDPMDPASYSDIPRGTWSTGLDRRGSAKTGVDATASGPLFQQRPYPSPGAILRMNKGATTPEEDDD